MDIEVQPTLLRVLQNRAVRAVGSDREVAIDCRVVAATNRDLESEVEAGRFRADLYARLAQVRVNVRPLRERHWEILSLFSQFAELSSASQLSVPNYPAHRALPSPALPYQTSPRQNRRKYP
jgi:transcriptional regulator with GAF, ATPase, and Fis domain